MNWNSIKLWTTALRSGNYSQGKFLLRKNDKFCCLGVACEVYINRYEGLFKTLKVTKNYDDVTFYDDFSQRLPYTVRHWLGISNAQEEALIVRNDGEMTQLDFSQIADYIESEAFKSLEWKYR